VVILSAQPIEEATKFPSSAKSAIRHSKVLNDKTMETTAEGVIQMTRLRGDTAKEIKKVRVIRRNAAIAI